MTHTDTARYHRNGAVFAAELVQIIPPTRDNQVVVLVQPQHFAHVFALGTFDILDVLAIDGQKVGTLVDFYNKLWSSGGPGTAIRLNVLQGGDVREIDVRSIDRQQYMRARPGL